VRSMLARWGLDRGLGEDALARVAAVPGDLAAPRLGLGDDDHARLAELADVIFHSGGQVDFVLPYAALRPANVGGTLEILRLATTRRTSPVHVVSTLGVFLGSAHERRLVTERDRPDDPAGLGSGYNQSKWVADALVRAARDRGVPVTLHRPARVTGDSRTGAANHEDYFNALLKACVEVGAVPLLPGGEDMAPVDQVAAAIVRLSLAHGSAGRSFHYFNGRTIGFAEIATELDRCGYRVAQVDYRGWRGRIGRGVVDGAVTSFAPFAALLPDAEPVATEPEFDCRVTEQAAARHGLAWPTSTGALLRRQLEYCVARGFLPRPDRS
jgi:myxalamid-type nonribosomal peptide synthetase MxaA